MIYVTVLDHTLLDLCFELLIDSDLECANRFRMCRTFPEVTWWILPVTKFLQNCIHCVHFDTLACELGEPHDFPHVLHWNCHKYQDWSKPTIFVGYEHIWTYMNIYELQFCFLDTFLMWTTGYPGIENWWFGRSRTWPAICESVALFFPPCPYGSMNCFYRENLHESIDFSIKSNGFPSNKSRFPSSIKPIQKNKGISQCVAWFNR